MVEVATECYDFQDTWLNPHRQVLPAACPSPPSPSCPHPGGCPGPPAPLQAPMAAWPLCVLGPRRDSPGHLQVHGRLPARGLMWAHRRAGRAARSWGGRRGPRSATPSRYQPCCQQPCLFPACVAARKSPRALGFRLRRRCQRQGERQLGGGGAGCGAGVRGMVGLCVLLCHSGCRSPAACAGGECCGTQGLWGVRLLLLPLPSPSR